MLIDVLLVVPMHILFIEDELDLQASGVAQLEAKGHTVYPTKDLAESRAILADPNIKVDLIISDHRLPDGQGIQFVLEIRKQFPRCRCAIVSGCLTPADIDILKENKVKYYHKPLLYAKVIDDMRKKPSLETPVFSPPVPLPERAAESPTNRELKTATESEARLEPRVTVEPEPKLVPKRAIESGPRQATKRTVEPFPKLVPSLESAGKKKRGFAFWPFQR